MSTTLVSPKQIVMDTRQLYASITNKLPMPCLFYPELCGDFLVIDLEISCLGRQPGELPRITQIGFGWVRQGEPVRERFHDVTIQTPYHPNVWGAAYLNPMFKQLCLAYDVDYAEACRAIDENNGSIMGLECIPTEIQRYTDKSDKPMFSSSVDITGITPEYTVKHGMPRSDAIYRIAEVLLTVRKAGVCVVGHNICGFDLPRLANEITEQGFGDLSIADPNMVIDTGMLVKAAQSGSLPYADESLWDFFTRVNGEIRRIKWSLDGFCVEAFELDKKYGVDTSQQHHSAGYDAWVTSCLLKELACD